MNTQHTTIIPEPMSDINKKKLMAESVLLRMVKYNKRINPEVCHATGTSGSYGAKVQIIF